MMDREGVVEEIKREWYERYRESGKRDKEREW